MKFWNMLLLQRSENWRWLQTMVNAVTAKSNKGQEQNVAVDTVKPSSAAVTLFGTLVQ